MTLPSSERYKLHQPVVPTTDFLVTFPIFSIEDLTVVVGGSETELFSVTASFVSGRAEDAVVVLNDAVSDVDVEIYGARTPRRENHYGDSSPRLAQNLQNDADQLTAVQQELARTVRGSLSVSPQHPNLTPLSAGLVDRADRVLGVSKDGKALVAGPSLSEISNAQQHAEVATNKAGDAAESAELAEQSAANVASVLSGALQGENNLSELSDKDVALDNLGLTTKGKELVKAATAAAMRTVLGLKAGALAEKADQPTAEAGQDDEEYMTALATAQAIAAQQKSDVIAWVNFDGTGTPTIRGAKNVSSIIDNGVGRYTINFASPVDNTNYAVVPGGVVSADGTKGVVGLDDGWSGPAANKTVSAFDIKCGTSVGVGLYDFREISLLVLGGVS